MTQILILDPYGILIALSSVFSSPRPGRGLGVVHVRVSVSVSVCANQFDWFTQGVVSNLVVLTLPPPPPK